MKRCFNMLKFRMTFKTEKPCLSLTVLESCSAFVAWVVLSYCIYGNKLPSVQTRLWCVLAVDTFPRVSSAQVLKDKALLYSLSGDGTISSLCASVPLFFPCSCSRSLGLARLRNSVDHTLGICFFFSAVCWKISLHLTWQFSWCHDSVPSWTHPEFMSSLGSNELDGPFVLFCPIIKNKKSVH